MAAEEARIRQADWETPSPGAGLVGGGERFTVGQGDIAAPGGKDHATDDGKVAGLALKDAVFAGEHEVCQTARLGGGDVKASIVGAIGGDKIAADEVTDAGAKLEVLKDADGGVDGGEEAVVERVKAAAAFDGAGDGFVVAEVLELRVVFADVELERAGLERLAGNGGATATAGAGAMVGAGDEGTQENAQRDGAD